jgi:uncharacterized protein (DUF1330 family)
VSGNYKDTMRIPVLICLLLSIHIICFAQNKHSQANQEYEHLTQNNNLPAYIIIEIEIIDKELYSDYIRRVRPIVEKYGGCYLARGGKVTPLAGDWSPERIVLIEFPSLAELKQCFDSQEYKAVAPLREQSTHGKAIIVEGYIDNRLFSDLDWDKQKDHQDIKCIYNP